jgi:hypothetical protein
MHESVLEFTARVITAGDVAGQHVIEAGSANVNGSVRPQIMAMGPASYTGIDLAPGPGVDLVMDAADLQGPAGLVVSTSMLEHSPDWQGALRGVVGAVAPGGVLVLTVPSAGFAYHNPPDHWRFSAETVGQVIEGAGLEVLELEEDPQAPGAFLKARKPDGWSWPDGAAACWAAAQVTAP